MKSGERIVLGTAQFGSSYGISNSSGMPDIESIGNILSLAKKRGVTLLDTAIGYGYSERYIGETGAGEFGVITKIGGVPADLESVVGWFNSEVESSLSRLGVKHLAGLLLHRPGQLSGSDGNRIYDALVAQKRDGKTLKIGVSVYSPDDLEQIPSGMAFDIVQVPLNLLDRRATDSGWISRLSKLGCEVHARSVFLQGLLLMGPNNRPPFFSKWNYFWDEWDSWLLREKSDPVSSCLSYVLSVPGVDKAVIGVETRQQLEHVLDVNIDQVPDIPDFPVVTDIDLLNPSRWPRK